jgi:hypothetical protein
VIRFVIYVLVAIVVVWFATTVKLGEYTCAGHMKRIWNSEETKDLREGVKKKATSESTEELVDEMKEGAKPVVDRLKNGERAGASEAEAGGEAGPELNREDAKNTKTDPPPAR